MTPACSRECGSELTVTLRGPLGALARFLSANSMAAPSNSERIGRNQYVAYSRHSVCGVVSSAACRMSELMYSASCSARRSVMLRANPRNVRSMASGQPRSHSSAAIVKRVWPFSLGMEPA